MAFYILQTTTEDAPKSKDGATAPIKKRRIELSPHPMHVNLGMRMDDFLSKDGAGGGSGAVVRGKIVSIEDHGCLIDIGISNGSKKQAFLKFENIEGDYEIVEAELMEIDEAATEKTEKKKSARMINPHRVYDFILSGSQNGPILQLSLPTATTMARLRLSNSFTPTLSSFVPGMAVEVRVEQFAKNGICVNFMGGLFRGCLDEDHLGGWRGFDDEKKGGDVMWWKNVFRGKHAKVSFCSLVFVVLQLFSALTHSLSF